MQLERRTVYFSGKVQGVGFRYNAVSAASDLPLAGTVRNLPDARVELKVTGAKGDIDKLLDRLGEHFGEKIRNMQQSTDEILTGDSVLEFTQLSASRRARIRIEY
jgi:acylphosphatase